MSDRVAVSGDVGRTLLQLREQVLGWLIDLGYAGAFVGILLMLCLLPDGRWQPRWTLSLAIFWTVWIVSGLFFPQVAPEGIVEIAIVLTDQTTVPRRQQLLRQ